MSHSSRSVTGPIHDGLAAIWGRIRGRKQPKASFALRALSHKALQSAHGLISSSRYFDADWYKHTYVDVAKSGEDPILHYLRVGAAEGRDPSELFSTSWYLHQNNDVAKAGINPLLHFLKSGEREGRSPRARVHSLPTAPAWLEADDPFPGAEASQTVGRPEVVTRSFGLTGAFLLELRIGIVTEDRTVASALLQIEFRDENDNLLSAAFSRAEWTKDYATLLVLPRACLDEDSRPLCCSTRFLSPPYGAKNMTIVIHLASHFHVDRMECTPVDISTSTDITLDGVEQYERARRKFLSRALKSAGTKFDKVKIKTDGRAALHSLRAVMNARNGERAIDWGKVIEAYSPLRDMAWSYDREQRMKTMPSVVVATICGDRLSSILSKHFTVVRLVEGEWKDRLTLSGASMIVIETVPADTLGQWDQALLGLEGAVSGELRSLLEWAKKKRLPIVAYATASKLETSYYRELLATADHVIVESHESDEPVTEGHPRRQYRVQPSFEHRLAGPAPVSVRPAVGMGIVFANASDLWISTIASMVTELPEKATLITEATYDIHRAPLEEYGIARHFVAGSLQYRQLLHVWRCAAVALFCEDTLVTKERQAQMVLDALGCGAVPIFVGDSSTLGKASTAMLQVHDSIELADILAFMADPVARERAWLRLYRHAVETMSFERSALPILAQILGRVPPPDPKALCIVASKRPARIRQFIEDFARQTYRNKELVVVLNCGPSPETKELTASDLPQGVTVKCVGATPNIGWCLNLAISGAEYDYWLKMDDDDHYGPNYITDLINQMVASGADAGGKPPFVVHLSESTISLFRLAHFDRGRRYLKFREYVCGATICGRKGFGSFSYRTRNANDTDWNDRMHMKEATVYLADSHNFAVARSGSQGDHTWKVSDSWFLSEDFISKNSAIVIRVRHPLQYVQC